MKPIKIDWKNNSTRFQAINISILSVGAIFLMVFAYFVFQVINTNNLIEEARVQQTKLQGEISYFNLARKLTENDVDVYNTLLLRLIPEVEDYFSIIASLERLSLYTGLDVSRYSIDLPDSGSDKFTLSIVGTVPQSILPLFLKNYQYGTGRLVTIENMTITNSSENNVQVVLNFYSREVTTSNLLKVGSLSQDDITLMQGIKEQIEQGEEQAATLQQLRQAEASLSGTPVRPSPSIQRTPTPR